jgi:hypothetical protein
MTAAIAVDASNIARNGTAVAPGECLERVITTRD